MSAQVFVVGDRLRHVDTATGKDYVSSCGNFWEGPCRYVEHIDGDGFAVSGPEDPRYRLSVYVVYVEALKHTLTLPGNRAWRKV